MGSKKRLQADYMIVVVVSFFWDYAIIDCEVLMYKSDEYEQNK